MSFNKNNLIRVQYDKSSYNFQAKCSFLGHFLTKQNKNKNKKQTISHFSLLPSLSDVPRVKRDLFSKKWNDLMFIGE